MSMNKEPHYFSSYLTKSDYPRITRTKDHYLRLFSKAGERIAGEASTFYLWDPDSAKMIHSVVPDAKIIIILRDPVERAFSHYLDIRRVREFKGQHVPSFKECLQNDPSTMTNFDDSFLLVELGLYSNQVIRYLDVFGEEQVKILIFEEFFKDPRTSVAEILDFLNVKAPIPNIVGRNYNPYTFPRNKLILSLMRIEILDRIIRSIFPQPIKNFLSLKLLVSREKPVMNEEDALFLRDKYHDDRVILEQIIGRPLPWS